jgi:hypothetical protein
MKVRATCLLLLACAILGRPDTVPPKDAPRVVESDLRREKDPHFTAEEQRMLVTAHRYADNDSKKKSDVYLKLTPTPQGYDVFMLFVGGYRGNQPLFFPGGFCIVHLDKSGKALSVSEGD